MGGSQTLTVTIDVRGQRPPAKAVDLAGKHGQKIAAAGTPTLAVTHRGVIRAIFAEATGWDMRGKPPARLEWDAAHLFTLAASLADKPRLDIGMPHVVWPPLGFRRLCQRS